jgi:hypothetical protein
MITYTYKCLYHGEFETEHKINEKLTDCPQCKSEGKFESYCSKCDRSWDPEDRLLIDMIRFVERVDSGGGEDYYCTNCRTDEGVIRRTPQVIRLISGGGSFILNGGCWAKDSYSK